MKNPAISVLMSVFNSQDYLREAVDSVLGQSFTDFELIIINDGSTDGSASILASYDDPRLRVVHQDTNKGLVAALNLGLSISHGEFIARMDSDDVCVNLRFELQVNALRAHPEVVLIGTSYILISADGVPFDTHSMKEDNEAIQKLLLVGNQFCHPSVMMRRDALTNVGGYRDIGGRYAQDYDLWLRMAECGKVMNLAAYLLKYRVHEGQVSVTKAWAQRYAAEFYKLLATQRRELGVEDIVSVSAALSEDKRRLRRAVVEDLFNWARIFEKQGRDREAREVKWRAIKTMPWSPSVRQLLLNWIVQKIRKLSVIKT